MDIKKQNIIAVVLIFLFVGFLFHKSIIKGYIPFPGDALRVHSTVAVRRCLAAVVRLCLTHRCLCDP